MSRAVYRARISVDVMLAADSAEEAGAELGAMSLMDILQDADDGAIISGPPSRGALELVPPDQVRDELFAIGNDGSFFDFDIGEHDDDDGNP